MNLKELAKKSIEIRDALIEKYDVLGVKEAIVNGEHSYSVHVWHYEKLIDLSDGKVVVIEKRDCEEYPCKATTITSDNLRLYVILKDDQVNTFLEEAQKNGLAIMFE